MREWIDKHSLVETDRLDGQIDMIAVAKALSFISLRIFVITRTVNTS